MRKLSFAILTLIMCLCSNIMVFATEENESRIITADEYESRIKEEIEKYSVECHVIEYYPGVVITEEALEADINTIKMYFENDNRKEEFDIQSTLIEKTKEQITPYLMPVTKDVRGTTDIVCSTNYGSASIRVDANVTVNAQNGNVMYINSLDAYQYGQFINFVSWQTTSISGTLNNPFTGYITVNVQGRGTFSIPVSVSTVGITEDFYKNVVINCK